nr:MAG TPA: hypothetical protein [Bacteriophage sp.]
MRGGIKNDRCFFDKESTDGRPKLVLNEEGKKMLVQLFSRMCTHEDVEALMDVDIDTLKAPHNIEAFSSAKKKGFAQARYSLRSMQFMSASEGNVPMQIWLGKQYLGQKEPTHETTPNEHNENYLALIKALEIVRNES